MSWLAAGKFALAHWQAGLALAFAGLFVKSCHDRDAANVAKGVAEAQAAQRAVDVHVKDSTAGVLRVQLAAANAKNVKDSTDLARQMTTLEQRIGRVDTLRLASWMHDTVVVDGETRIEVPAPVVASADSALHACTEYVSSCAAFRASAFKRFANDSLELLLLKKPQPQAHGLRRCGITATAGGAIVYALGKTNELAGGPALVLGLGCRW